MKPIGRYAMLAMALGATNACSSGSGSTSQVDTGLSETQLLSSVSPEEAIQACQAIESTFSTRLDPQKLLTALCELLGAALTSTEDECRQMADTCMEQSQTDEDQFNTDDFEPDFDCTDGGAGADLATCDATVGELEKCYASLLTELEQSIKQFTCADAATVTQESLAELAEAEEPPASCQALSSQCPELDW